MTGVRIKGDRYKADPVTGIRFKAKAALKPNRPIRLKVENDADRGLLWKDLRAQLGYSQRQWADRLHGPARSNLVSWETGRYSPRLESIVGIADTLSMDLYIEFRPKVLLGGHTWEGSTDEDQGK